LNSNMASCSDDECKIVYIYPPITDDPDKGGFNMLDLNQHMKWKDEMLAKYMKEPYNYIFAGFSYWKLEIFSCVLVPRNEKWFRKHLPSFQELWNTIVEIRSITDETERQQRCQEYAPKRRRQTSSDNNTSMDDFVHHNHCRLQILTVDDATTITTIATTTTTVNNDDNDDAMNHMVMNNNDANEETETEIETEIETRPTKHCRLLLHL